MPGKSGNHDYELKLKIVFIGDEKIGKSSLIKQDVDNNFSDTYCETIGVDFKIKNVEINGKKIKFHLWDTAGEERFDTITESFYRGANIIAICVDINAESDSIRAQFNKCKNKIKHYASPSVKVVIMATKLDQLKEDVESRKALLREIQQENPDIVEGVFLTSAKENKSIQLNSDGTEKKELGLLNGVYEKAESGIEHSRVQHRVNAYNLSEPDLKQFLKATITKEQLKACLDHYYGHTPHGKAQRTGFTFWTYGSKSMEKLQALHDSLNDNETVFGDEIWGKLSPHRQKALQNFSNSGTKPLAKNGTNFVIREIFLTALQLNADEVRNQNPFIRK